MILWISTDRKEFSAPPLPRSLQENCVYPQRWLALSERNESPVCPHCLPLRNLPSWLCKKPLTVFPKQGREWVLEIVRGVLLRKFLGFAYYQEVCWVAGGRVVLEHHHSHLWHHEWRRVWLQAVIDDTQARFGRTHYGNVYEMKRMT